MTNPELKNAKDQWVKWVAEIQAIAQTGLTFAKCPFDIQRYQLLREIAAEILATYSDTPLQKIMAFFAENTGYATPKIDVRGAVFKENKILLVKERSDQKWTLPGGFADVNYSPAFCVKKEIMEESGFDVSVQKLIGLFDKLKHDHPLQLPHTYKCFFLCHLRGGTPRPSIETSDVAFFSLESLPELSLPRVTKAQIERCYAHYCNPELPTEFD